MNKRYYSYNRIHPLAHQYSLGDWLSKQAGGKAADELWGMTKSGIGDALKGNAANIALGIGSKIINPNGNTTAFSDFGNTVGNLVGMIPGVGTVAGLGIKGITALTDAAFGSNVNEAAVRGLRADLNDAQNNIGSALTWDTLADSVEELGDINVANADLGSQGWFNHDVDKARNRLKRQQQMAQAAIDYAADNINTLENRQMMGTALADGGKIHIKPSKKGTFTAQATKMGMGVQEAASHILANKERYSPAMVKKANFARNASKWHAEGGPIFKTDYDMGLTFINEGGTHEQNPYGGVFMGMAPDGQPNQVEEGEIIFNDYVYSNRLKVPKAVRNKYKMREKKDLSFADAIEDYIKKNGIEERNNDPIANRGLEAFASELAMEQEMVKAKKEMKKTQNSFRDGGRRRLLTGYPNRNPKNVIETLANMVGTVRGLGMTEAQLDSLETDRRQKENLITLFGEDRRDWWKLSPTWNTPFWNEERRRPGTFFNPPTVDRILVPDVKRLQEGLDLILQKASEGREEANQGRRDTEGKEELNQRYSFANGGHIFDGESGSSIIQRPWIGYDKTKNEDKSFFDTLYNPNSNYMQGLNWLKNNEEARHQLQAAITRGDYDDPNGPKRINDVKIDDSNWWNLATDSKFGPVHNAFMQWTEANKDRWADYKVTPKIAGISINPEAGGVTHGVHSIGPNGPQDTLMYSSYNNGLAGPTQEERMAKNAEEHKQEEKSTYDPTYWWRMAGLGANAAGLMANILDPYHPQVLNEVRAPRMINPKYLGDYMEYTPYDINYATSQQDANNAATRNALMQSTAPIRNASLLANDFNANATRGATRRQALEYNDSLRKAVADFNRGTNQFNAQMYVDAAARNQAAKQAYFQDRLRQAQFNSQLDFQHKMLRDQAIGQGLTSIGDWFDALRREGIAKKGVDVFGSTMGTPNEEAKEYIEEATKENGGFLRKSLTGKPRKKRR